VGDAGVRPLTEPERRRAHRTVLAESPVSSPLLGSTTEIGVPTARIAPEDVWYGPFSRAASTQIV